MIDVAYTPAFPPPSVSIWKKRSEKALTIQHLTMKTHGTYRWS